MCIALLCILCRCCSGNYTPEKLAADLQKSQASAAKPVKRGDNDLVLWSDSDFGYFQETPPGPEFLSGLTPEEYRTAVHAINLASQRPLHGQQVRISWARKSSRQNHRRNAASEKARELSAEYASRGINFKIEAGDSQEALVITLPRV